MSGKSTKDLPLSDKQLEEVGQKIVKRGRGHPVGAGGYERPDRQVQTAPGDNTKYISHSLRLAGLPKISMQNPEEVEKRVTEYFTICAEEDMKPSMAGLALAFGVTRQYVWMLQNEVKGKNAEVVNIIKKAVQILDTQMVDYMQNGKINPVSGIFIMKNAYGYVDKQEVIVTPQSPLGDTKDNKALEEQYINSTVDEE